MAFKVSNETKVGALAAVAITILVLGYNYISGRDSVWSSGKTYYAYFNDLNGLGKSNPIVYKGYKIGQVSDIEFQKDEGNFMVELDIQKDVVTEEIYQTVIDRPYGKWRDHLSTIAFRNDCSYSWEVQGLIDDVRSVTLEDAKAFRDRYYKPSNAVLTLCGDVDVEAAFALIEKYFNEGNGTPESVDRNNFVPEMRLTGGIASYEDDVPHSAVFVSFHCAGFAEGPEDYVAKIYTDIMARGRSSRLYNSLVYEKELASHSGVFFDKREN